MPKISVNNQSIYYEIHGKQKDIPLVLIAGLGCDHTMWSSILDALVEKHQVIVIDNRGCGQSSQPIEKYTIQDMAFDVAALLESLNIHKVDVIGNSMGGMIAQELAISFPTLINKLILYSSLVKLKLRTQRLLLATARLFELELYDDVLQSILTNAYGDKFFANEQLVQKILKQMKSNPYPQSLDSFRGQFNALRETDTSAKLHKINAPTLIIAGTRDILSLRDDAEDLAAISNSVIMSIPDVGHQAHIEDPQKFLQIVLEFLG